MKRAKNFIRTLKSTGNRVRWSGYMGRMRVERMRAEKLGG